MSVENADGVGVQGFELLADDAVFTRIVSLVLGGLDSIVDEISFEKGWGCGIFFLLLELFALLFGFGGYFVFYFGVFGGLFGEGEVRWEFIFGWFECGED